MIAKKNAHTSARKQPTKKLIVGNWKMYIDKPQDALELVRAIALKAKNIRNAKIVMCPAWPLLGCVFTSRKGKASPVQFGVQDISLFDTGAHTGEVSATMAIKSGATYAIVGHSERRSMGESDDIVAKKALNALSAGLIPIVCVGETERDQHGLYLGLLKKQILASLASVQKSRIANVVLAYEPVYAVSGKKPLDSVEIEHMYLYIRKVLVDTFGPDASKTKILYGGSVFAENVADILHKAGVDGLLLGRASAEAKEVITIASLV